VTLPEMGICPQCRQPLLARTTGVECGCERIRAGRPMEIFGQLKVDETFEEMAKALKEAD
jgi:hypothetical protein